MIAASAGNHAQGVALAASILGIRATVVMPENVQLPKLTATRAYGADVVLHGANITDSLARAAEIAGQTGSTLIHPFEHADIIAGQGTVGLEIAEQCAQARTVVVPVGGGGLVAGIAVALRGRPAGSAAAGPVMPGPAVIGVQAAAVAPLPASLAAGRPVGVTAAPTMADGIAVAVPGAITFQIIQELVGQILTVTEEGLSRALLTCLERGKQLVEPAGAAGVAALLEHPGAVEPPVVVVLSGGNIDPLLLSRVLRYGLAAAGRYLAVRCRIPDLAGSLAALLTEIGTLGASVLDVVHERVSAGLRIDEVEVTHAARNARAGPPGGDRRGAGGGRLHASVHLRRFPDHDGAGGLVVQGLPSRVPDQPQVVDEEEERYDLAAQHEDQRPQERRGQADPGAAAGRDDPGAEGPLADRGSPVPDEQPVVGDRHHDRGDEHDQVRPGGVAEHAADRAVATRARRRPARPSRCSSGWRTRRAAVPTGRR